MPIKTSSAKAKGRQLQQYVADKIIDSFELDIGDAESRPMGSPGVDVYLSPAARKLFPFSIECKSVKNFSSTAAIKQSQENAYEGTIPIAVWKPKGKSLQDSLVCMKFEDLLKYANL